MSHKKYNIIYIDVPWQYNKRRNTSTKFGGGAMKHYPTMTVKEIMDMKSFINNIADENCIMFHWVTCPKLDVGVDVLKHWGFKYCTVGFTWVKTTKDGNYRKLPGFYTSSNVELCLIGVKQKKSNFFKPDQCMLSQVIAEPTTVHSKKPHEIRKRIELMYPDYPKVEIFARGNYDGWDCIGYDADGTDVRIVDNDIQ